MNVEPPLDPWNGKYSCLLLIPSVAAEIGDEYAVPAEVVTFRIGNPPVAASDGVIVPVSAVILLKSLIGMTEIYLPTKLELTLF